MGRTEDEKLPMNIPEFYKGKSIFITGFTGCVGKLLVEKILYSCPEVNKFYVLVRSKKDQNPHERVKQVLTSMAFDRIREHYPGVLESKIVPIAGDISKEGFGISREDEDVLKREVNVIFHGAASVRFDDPLEQAFKQNTLGAKTMADLALKMPKVAVLMYISTAYSNCDHLNIKEEIYPPKADWRFTKKICENIDKTTLSILTAKYINHMPNTYVFTKSLSEQIINEFRDRLPVVIVRPSIVIPAVEEPIPGWTDNKYGPLALILGFLLGIIRCSYVDVKQKCNYIYSDAVINSIIIASWKTALMYNAKILQEQVKVYNACTPQHFNMNHKDFSLIYTKGETVKHMIKENINFVNLMFIKNHLWYRFNVIIRHFLSASIIDLILKLANKKPLLISIRRKAFIASDALSYFTMRTFTFHTDNFDNLLNDLRAEDKEAFKWEWTVSVGHTNYYHTVFLQAKHSIIKPLFDDLENTRKRLLFLYCVDTATVYLTYSLLAYLMYAMSIPQVLYSLMTSALIL